MKEKNNFLFIYAIIIIIMLVLIMFVLPDSFFSRQYEENTQKFQEAQQQEKEKQEKIEAEKKKEYVDYEIQKKQILNGNYEYEYILMDSMGTQTFTYKCTGKKSAAIDSGSCTSPDFFSYTEKDKTSKFKEKIDPTYIEEKNIFNLINNIEPALESHNLYREYTYKTKIKDLDTTIIIQTTKDNISKITIYNSFMQYILNYSNVKVDN